MKSAKQKISILKKYGWRHVAGTIYFGKTSHRLEKDGREILINEFHGGKNYTSLS